MLKKEIFFKKLIISFIIINLVFNIVPSYAEEEKNDSKSALEQKIERLEKLLNSIEKKQRAKDVMSDLQQTEEEKKEKEEDILDAAGREYTLADPGILNLSYGISYSGDTYDQLRQITDDNNKTSTQVKHINSHTLTNSVSVKYPLQKNLTLSVSLPFTMKYLDNQSGSKQGVGIGDPGVTIQYQPFKPVEGIPTTILSAGLDIPLGTSPFEVNESELATGSGYYSVSVSANFSKSIDPVIAYGGVSYSKSFDADGLSYNPDKEQKAMGIYIYKANPGDQISANIGMGYSLSYLVSISTGFQYTYSFKSEYYWKYVGKNSSPSSYSSSFAIGTNWKITPKRSINTSLSIGLFSSNSDVSLSVSIPFDFKIDELKNRFKK